MRDRTTFADWLRAKRLERGIQSAAALGRSAGLSVSHVAMFERGEVLPRWNTAERIAGALDLNGDERAEFFSLLTVSRQPQTVRDATAGLAIPGLSVWRYFPKAIFASLNWRLQFFARFCADEVLVNGVRGLSSLLACVEVFERRPPKRRLERITTIANQIMSESLDFYEALASPPVDSNRMAADTAKSALPLAWRSDLFAERRDSLRLAKSVAEWCHFDRGYRASDLDLLRVRLRDREINERWGFEYADADLIVATHDALAASILWKLTGFSERFGQADEEHTPRIHLKTAIKIVMKGARPDWVAGGGAIYRMQFAKRLYIVPELAETVIGHPWEVIDEHCVVMKQQIDDEVARITRRGTEARSQAAESPKPSE